MQLSCNYKQKCVLYGYGGGIPSVTRSVCTRRQLFFFPIYLCRQAQSRKRPKRVSVSSPRLMAVQMSSSIFPPRTASSMRCRRDRLSRSTLRTVKKAQRPQTLSLLNHDDYFVLPLPAAYATAERTTGVYPNKRFPCHQHHFSPY